MSMGPQYKRRWLKVVLVVSGIHTLGGMVGALGCVFYCVASAQQFGLQIRLPKSASKVPYFPHGC